jgi:hypothetical protein
LFLHLAIESLKGFDRLLRNRLVNCYFPDLSRENTNDVNFTNCAFESFVVFFSSRRVWIEAD